MHSVSSFEFWQSEFSVSHETFEKLCVYKDALLTWNAKINLIARDTIEEIWQRHLLDSAQLFPLIQNIRQTVSRETSTDFRLVDMGCGAGLPGIVLAMMGIENVTLIESDERKCGFLHRMNGELDLGMRVITKRIEAANEEVNKNVSHETFTLVTSRALASLTQLCHYAFPFLGENGVCLFPKGENWNNELTQAQEEWQMQWDATPSVTHEKSILLTITSLEPRN